MTPGALDAAVTRATDALLALQRGDGHWVFELEADATIPAEYVLFVHYLGETPDLALERKIGVYLRRIQGEHGGWPLYHGGVLDVSATVKAYFALKMIGDDIEAPHMVRAREALLARQSEQGYWCFELDADWTASAASSGAPSQVERPGPVGIGGAGEEEGGTEEEAGATAGGAGVAACATAARMGSSAANASAASA